MLSFVVFDDPAASGGPILRHAHLLAADQVAIAGQIRYDEGAIKCEPEERGSTALALQWDAGPIGQVTLQTTLLPHRDEPYLLTLELARHRIMLLLVKLEEWGCFDLPADDAIMLTFEAARRKFTEALVADRNADRSFTPEQDRAAREALQLALEASEMLTVRHAAESLRRRLAPNEEGGEENAAASSSRPSIGCVVPSTHFTEALQRVVSGSFDYLVAPLRWSDLEPEEGDYSFTRSDRWIEWAVRKAKMPVVAGPIVDLRAGCVPDWLYIWENDYETLRELVYEHIKKIVTRYRRAVSRWILVSGLHAPTSFRLSIEQAVDLTRIASMLVRKLQPRARIHVEIAQPFGEYSAAVPTAIAPDLYAELLAQAGVSVDSLGLQVQMGDVSPGRATRDLMAVADLIDRFSELQRPIIISALGAPSEPPSAEDSGEGLVDPGFWRQPWSEEAQREWLTHVASVALSKPLVTSVCWQALYDTSHEADMPAGGLITSEGRSKPALSRLAEIRRRIHQRREIDDLLLSTHEPATTPA